MRSANVATATFLLVLLQHTSVVAKLVTPTMIVGNRRVEEGAPLIPKWVTPDLSDVPAHLDSLVGDTSEEPEIVTAQARKPAAMRGAETDDVRANLISVLVATFREGGSQARLAKWKAALTTMFAALPKNAHGNLGHAAAKYALHRAFVQQHSWSLSGLEPSDAKWNASLPLGSLSKWVPEYLLGLIEQLLGTQGINLHELSVMAATFEDLAHKEAINRLREIFEALSLSTTDPIDKSMAQHVIQMYMTMYTSANGAYAKTFKDVVELGLGIDGETQAWLEEVQKNMTGIVNGDEFGAGWHGMPEKHDFASMADFTSTTRVVEEIGERFGSFNDRECRALKSILLGMETPRKPGRVALSDFYKEGMNEGYWNFNEKVEYLRAVGALDESDSAKPQLVIPNYVSSRSNCIASSNFYAVCCRNECEGLLGHLEAKVGAPMADAVEIANLISTLSSDTVKAPRQLPKAVLLRLEEIAQAYDGKVPLHGRMFAQWMHHAFPRECPYPHLTDENPQTPDEWMKDAGSIKASKEEMLRHIQNETMRSRVTLNSNKEERAELPWSSVEQLLDDHHTSVLFKENLGQPSSPASQWLQYGFLAAVFIIVASLGGISKASQEASYSKKFDCDNSNMQKWNVQSCAVQASPLILKHRSKAEAAPDSCQLGV